MGVGLGVGVEGPRDLNESPTGRDKGDAEPCDPKPPHMRITRFESKVASSPFRQANAQLFPARILQWCPELPHRYRGCCHEPGV